MKEASRSVVGGLPFVALAVAVVGATLALLASPLYYIAPLPSVALLGGMLLVRWPVAAYYLIVWLIPFGAYRSLGGPLQFVKIHWILAFVLLVVVALRHLVTKKLDPHLRSHLWPLFFGFFAVNLIATILSPYPAKALNDFILLIIGYLFVFLSLAFVSERGFLRSLPAAIIWSISFGSLLAVVSYFVQGGSAVVPEGMIRSVGGSTDPNQLALFILFVLPFLVHRLLRETRWARRFVALALIAVNLAAMVTTFSRGGALGLLVVVVVLFVEHVRRFRPTHLGMVLGAVAAAIVAIAVTVPPQYWQRQMTLTSKTDRSIDRRKSYLVVGWEAFKQRPIVGFGPGTFSSIYSESEYAKIFARDETSLFRDAHNTYLQVLVGTGVIGLVLFIGILWLTWNDFSRARRLAAEAGRTDLQSLIVSYRTAFLVTLFYLLIISNTHNKHLLLCFAVSQVALRVARNPEGRSDDDALAVG